MNSFAFNSVKVLIIIGLVVSVCSGQFSWHNKKPNSDDPRIQIHSTPALFNPDQPGVANYASGIHSEEVRDAIKEIVSDKNVEDPFHMIDVMDIVNKYKKWVKHIPRVRPHFAVKSNPTPLILEVLTGLGAGFDCASKAEVEMVKNLGVPSKDIIFAHTYKSINGLKYARSVGVDLMTFDSEHELEKIKIYYRNARLVLRVAVDDKDALVKFSDKYGVKLNDIPNMIYVAKKLGLNIVGCSFHVGTGNNNPDAYNKAISDAKTCFNEGRKAGYNMNLLDIGGGYPGITELNEKYEKIAQKVNKALDKYFPDDIEKNLTIIAEPGRFFVASASTLATNIIGKRTVKNDKGQTVKWYILNDGAHASFNAYYVQHWTVYYSVLILNNTITREEYISMLWGPTCDSTDLIIGDIKIPEMYVGEWVLWENIGAYSVNIGSPFNGFPLPKVKYHAPESTLSELKKLRNWNRIKVILHEK